MRNQAVKSLGILLLHVYQLLHLFLENILVVARDERVEASLEVLQVFSPIVLICLYSMNQKVEGLIHIVLELVKLALVLLRELFFELLVDVSGVPVLLFLHKLL